MKKVFWLFTIIALLGCMFVLPSVKVKAEEIEQPEVTETETEETEKKDIDDYVKGYITEIADKYLGKYMDKQTIGLLVEIGVFALACLGTFVTNLIYRKSGKNGIDAFMNALAKDDGTRLTLFFESFKKEIQELKKENLELKEAMGEMMKVFVLSQDKSAEGKVAMLEYFGKHTNNKDIQDQIKQQTEAIQKQEEVKAEVNEKVEGDYQEIF